VDHRRVSDVSVEPEPVEQADVKRNGRPAADHDGMLGGFRATDIEPYTGLRYLSKLFRFMAIIMLLLLVAEIATGVYAQGAAAIPTLLGEASRLIVIAGVLWGTGDLAHLLIDVGHDVRASRILLARQTYHANKAAERADLAALERPVVPSSARSSAPPPIP
jgi:hypothetical protein